MPVDDVRLDRLVCHLSSFQLAILSLSDPLKIYFFRLSTPLANWKKKVTKKRIPFLFLSKVFSGAINGTPASTPQAKTANYLIWVQSSVLTTPAGFLLQMYIMSRRQSVKVEKKNERAPLLRNDQTGEKKWEKRYHANVTQSKTF